MLKSTTANLNFNLKSTKSTLILKVTLVTICTATQHSSLVRIYTKAKEDFQTTSGNN